jgi:hypothetical protein
MKGIYIPTDELELAVLRGVLDGEGIDHNVHNDNFGALRIGPQIHLYNTRTIMVSEENVGRATEIIRDYLSVVHDDEYRAKTAHSFIDRIRICAEFMVFGWLVPGRPNRPHDPGESARNIIMMVLVIATLTAVYGLLIQAMTGAF